MRKTGKVLKCSNCGNNVYKSAWELRKSKSEQHFCSRQCSNVYNAKLPEFRAKISKKLTGTKLSEATKEKCRIAAYGNPKPWIQGDKHPRWKGGIWGYPPEFQREGIRNPIRLRDGNKCRLCGRTAEEEKKLHNKALALHHVDHNRYNMDYYNLLTLCSTCNSKEITDVKIQARIQDIVNEMIRSSQQCEEVARNSNPPADICRL